MLCYYIMLYYDIDVVLWKICDFDCKTTTNNKKITEKIDK